MQQLDLYPVYESSLFAEEISHHKRASKGAARSVARVISQEKSFNSKLSGNEVYCTACYLLVILNISCSKCNGQKDFRLILFACRILHQKKPSNGGGAERRERERTQGQIVS